MSAFLRDLAALTRSLPGRFETSLRQWVIRQHRPEPVEVDGRPVEPYTVCRACGTPWPCTEYVELTDNNESVGNG